MSDLHLVAEGQLASRLDTTARLRCAIDHIDEFKADADICILVGDLANRGQPQAHRRLAQELRHLSAPSCLTIGNHDSGAPCRREFATVTDPDSEQVDCVIDLQSHRLVILDSVCEDSQTDN